MSTDSLRTSLAAGLATILTALALAPAYASQRWIFPSAGLVGVIALTGWALRRLRLPRAAVPLVQVALAAWVTLVVVAPAGMRWGVIPSSQALGLVGERLEIGYGLLMRFAAPLPYDPDLILVTALGVGVIALAVDLVAATLRLVPWAGLPLLILYTVPAVAVQDGLGFLVFIPAAIGYLILLESESHDRVAQWGRVIGLAQGLRRPPAAPGALRGTQGVARGSLAAGPGSLAGGQRLPLSGLAQTGRRVGVTVIGLAILVPAVLPSLPHPDLGQGSGSGPGQDSSTIRISNPMLDLRRDLRLPDNFDLFTYRTDDPDPDYLRLVALDVFDGKVWKPSQRSVPASHRVSGGMPKAPGLAPSVPRHRVTTRIHVSKGLRSKWLPLPYPAVSVHVPGDWRYDTATLDVVSRRVDQSTAGLRYTVTSLDIDEESASLARAPKPPSAVENRYTKTPGIPEEVKDLSRRVVGDAPTEFAKAAALQRWFRTQFVYSTAVPAGHSGSALMSFLKDKKGYCEQFAGTMAIMARTLGIPARVGVGYMPGTNIGGSRWQVKVHDAHAWPELYFAGHGWVRFEPTPAQHTGLAPVWTERYDARPADPNTTIPRGGDNAQPPQQAPHHADAEGLDAKAAQHEHSPGSGRGPRAPILPAAGLGALVLATLLVAPALARATLRRRRLRDSAGRGHARATGPVDRVGRAWSELADTAVDLGISWDNSTTPRAMGDRLERRVQADARPAVRQLVQAVERARYAREPDLQADLPGAVRTVDAALAARLPRWQRLRARAYPPSILSRLWATQHRLRTRLRDLRDWARAFPGRGRNVRPSDP